MERRSLEPAEVPIWDELEREVRAELEPQFDEARAKARDRAMRALVLSAGSAVIVLLPILAFIVGASVRIFRWASGL